MNASIVRIGDIGAILILMTCGQAVHSQTLTFAEVWNKVSQSSSAQEGAQLKIQAAEEAQSRAARHWLPRIYLDAQTYRTNDPGAAFSGILEQRKISSQDFVPDSLNHPDPQTFTRGALGVDLSLFEGGLKQAQSTMYAHSTSAARYDGTQIQIEQYSQSAVAYETVALTQRQKKKLVEMESELTKLMKNYQLGHKANPVGYSGLLGMKSLSNRVAGLIDHMKAQEAAAYALLRELGVQPQGWSPQNIDTRAFVDRFIAVDPKTDDKDSYMAMAATENVKATEAAAKMERAKYMPRIGAFGQSYVFHGDRDTANGYAAGLYLQWNLFDPSQYGSYKEAKLKALATDRFNRASIQQENAERSALQDSLGALRANLVRLEESDRLLNEQTQVSSTLFKNGSISALQFVEILNRRTDLIAQQAETEMSLLKTSAALAAKSKFKIPLFASAEDAK